MITIEEILKLTPDYILSLSSKQLDDLLSPLFPSVRKALLPQEKARKIGLDRRMISSYLEANKETIEAMKKQLRK